MKKLQLLRLNSYPIFQQLQIEEALLRTDMHNWCILNEGSPPAVVMGISADPEQVLDLSLIEKNPIPMIRRFSGGGTVVVDLNTIFVTFIFNQEDIPEVPCYPEPVLRWTVGLYQTAFPEVKISHLENDYVLKDRKFGGNAQYFRKQRWLHHSSLLWNFDPQKMKYLLLPPKTPQYRKNRSHEDFLCGLCNHFSDRRCISEGLLCILQKRFLIEERSLCNLQQILQQPHRKSTEVVATIIM